MRLDGSEGRLRAERRGEAKKFRPEKAICRSIEGGRQEEMKARLQVMKFGGTSVGDASCIARAVEIIAQAAKQNGCIAVVSAMSGVTNRLIEAAKKAQTGNSGEAAAVVDALRQQHEAALTSLIQHQEERVRIQQRMEEVLAECMRIALERCERQKTGESKPMPTPNRPGPGRHIPAQVKRVVWKRDDGKCAYVGPTGKRCGSTHQVQFHHEHAHALGGSATVENISLRCRAHNIHEARKDFGEEHMSLFLGS